MVFLSHRFQAAQFNAPRNDGEHAGKSKDHYFSRWLYSEFIPDNNIHNTIVIQRL